MVQNSGGFHLQRALFPAGYYASNSIYQGYMSLYYTHLGFHNGQLGAIGAATAAVSLAFQPIWGALGDRSRSRRRLLAILCLSSALALPAALLHRSFPAQLFTAAAFYAFFCALLPLGDAILLEADGGRFGAYRLAGGVAFALASAVFGAIRGFLPASAAIWTTSALLLLTAPAALFLPDSPGMQRRKRLSPFVLLKDRQLAGMLLFILPLQAGMGFFYTFYAPRFKALPGGTDALLGLSYLLSTAGEIPYLLFSERIYRRFGAAKPMCAAALALALRWLLLGIAPNAWIALASQLLHGGGFIVVSVSMAHWIADHVPEELRASGQGLLNMASFGLARIAGSLGGGLLARQLGIENAFLLAAGLCVAALLLFAPRVFAKRG